MPFAKNAKATPTYFCSLPGALGDMKLTSLFLFIAFPLTALGQLTGLEIALLVREETGLKQLIDTSFGGGSYYRVEKSPFYVVDLMPTSGLLSTELYIFELVKERLEFRAHIPMQINKLMKAEISDGMLVISEHLQSEIEWTIRLYIVPMATDVGD